jgi:hypothetical protein
MKRILLSLAFAVGMFVAGVTNASASTLCTVDPTLGVGTPLHYSLVVTVNGTHLYVYGTSGTTTFGGVIGT